MKYLVLSDIHGNLHALDAILDRTVFDKVLFLGDIVDYGAYPNECIERLKRLKAICLVGNHDMVQTGDLSMGHMHGEAQQCGWWTKNTLTRKNLDWLKLHKPERIKDEFRLVHGSPVNPPLDYIDSTKKADYIFKNYEFNLLLHGHSHEPLLVGENEGWAFGSELAEKFADVTKTRCIINPGSVGQPRDGDERASYGTLEDGVFIWHRVEYDIAGAQKAIIDAGLPQSQAERLLYGN